MEHPAFAEAGAEPGLEIWTIDKFEPVLIERTKYGKFYNGDAYIVLKTSGDNTSTLNYDAHFWIGVNATQDKRGAAAILTVTLDDQLGGRAIQHREVQGHESSQFVGYFKPAIRYLEGGNESGFNEVEINAGAEKRLLKLSGCENMRIAEVPADVSSLTRDNCFILEVEHDIYVLVPEGARATQRRKIISVANNLRDEEHNGRATIEIIDEYSSNSDYDQFFDALGSGSLDDLVDEDTESIVAYTRDSISSVYLYKVLYDEDIELDALRKPFKQNQLESDGIFILDTPDAGVFIWLGRDVDIEVRRNYNDIAQKYLDVKEYPSWLNVTRISEGVESSTFKQYFHSWQTISSSSSVRARISEFDAGYFSSDADESANAAKYIGKSATARGYMPDDGSGQVTIFRASEEPEDITEQLAEFSVLYQNDVYVVVYEYEADGQTQVIYLWIGENATSESKLAGIDLVSKLEEDLEGEVNVVRVPQGKETKHFLKILKGKVAILYGNKDDEYKPDNFNNSYDDDGLRLFRVEGADFDDMRIIQVRENEKSLQDDAVFIFETSSAIYVWNGKESNENEQEVALEFTKQVVKDDREVTPVNQGEEPEEFWEALGGAPEELESRSGWQQALSRRVTTPMTLTAVTVSTSGRVKLEELPPDFTQKDLSDDGVYILDGGEELYMWRGNKIPVRARLAKDKIIEKYILDDGLERTVDSAIVVTVKQGREPANFKKHFPEWEDDMWENQISYEDLKNQTKSANSREE
ncbi:gelsolin, cytoplasmic-like [Pieris brassicae]|uniref:Gelsolin-like domain-containing protein n=1 Tax=Pieris brassicae TaxID=7116 RepID=A0A9P0XCP9_PIEBR|nr:gelsolin, cytoplasmic-like [Pieris brassicae]CAH4033312.1 unnamed protein product [Pieris brassicae]